MSMKRTCAISNSISCFTSTGISVLKWGLASGMVSTQLPIVESKPRNHSSSARHATLSLTPAREYFRTWTFRRRADRTTSVFVSRVGTSLLRIVRRGRGDEFLEARIIPERIEHRIEPEQRRSQQHVYQRALVRYR